MNRVEPWSYRCATDCSAVQLARIFRCSPSGAFLPLAKFLLMLIQVRIHPHARQHLASGGLPACFGGAAHRAADPVVCGSSG